MSQDSLKSIVILHTKEGDETPSVLIIGGTDVRVFWVDDNAPDDRVYEMLARNPASDFRRIIPEGTWIGNMNDGFLEPKQ